MAVIKKPLCSCSMRQYTFHFFRIFWAWRAKCVDKAVTCMCSCMLSICPNQYVDMRHAKALPLWAAQLIDAFATLWSTPWITKCPPLHICYYQTLVAVLCDMYSRWKRKKDQWQPLGVSSIASPCIIVADKRPDILKRLVTITFSCLFFTYSTSLI